MKKLIYIILFIYSTIGVASTTFSSEQNISTTADGASSVFAIDVDSDGDIDILSGSEDDNRTVWYENNGSQSFTEHNISISSDVVLDIFSIDVDKDGDIDVLSANIDKIAWYNNDGSQNFTDINISTSGSGFNSVFAIDIDLDGDIDVLSASNEITLYENNGSQDFNQITISSATSAESVFAIDVDSDGDIDILSAYNNNISWYENNGSLSFTENNISTTTNGANSVYSIDVDGDGDIDVLSASGTNNNIAWHENNGSQTFVEHNISITASNAHSVYAIDLDSDGDIDVLSASYDDNRTVWYENNGSESFTEHNLSTSSISASDVFAIDVDNDGEIDVLSASYGDDKITWYENQLQIIKLNLTNVNLTEHNIINIQIIGTDDNNESLFIPEIFDGNISNGDNNYSTAIANYDKNITLRIDTNDSGASRSWWYNFTDLSLDVNNSGTDYKTEINATNHTFTVDFNTSNWENSAPIIFGSPDLNISATSQYEYILQATDVDVDTLSVSATALPPWLSLSSIADVSTFAGSDTNSSIDAQGINATFYNPSDVAVDSSGNIYVVDQNNYKIRKIDLNGNVTTFAGTGISASTDGNATTAEFKNPIGISVDSSDNLYVADGLGNKIRKIDTSGNVTTFAGSGSTGTADGNATDATFSYPTGVSVDSSGNIYVVDSNSHKIRKIDASGNVTTFAGTGTGGSLDGNATTAQFQDPSRLVVDENGNIYVSDEGNHKIRKIDASGNVTTFAGTGTSGSTDGNATTAQFTNPKGLTLDNNGNIYVADGSHKIRKIDKDGNVTTFAGSGSPSFADGNATSAQFLFPSGITKASDGTLYVADSSNHRIRKILPPSKYFLLNRRG